MTNSMHTESYRIIKTICSVENSGLVAAEYHEEQLPADMLWTFQSSSVDQTPPEKADFGLKQPKVPCILFTVLLKEIIFERSGRKLSILTFKLWGLGSLRIFFYGASPRYFKLTVEIVSQS
jgi:hypothetical protein